MKKTKIINTLKGVAFGDAFGVGIEFKSRPWIRDNVHFDRFLNEWKGGKNNILPGTYSDDTEHTIGVIEALLTDRPFSEGLLLEKFKFEYLNDKAVKGYPRDGHGSIEDWYLGRKTIEEVRQSQALREDPGNAPVMRAVPLSFIDTENIYNYSVINARSTHPHEMGIKATLLTVLTAWCFLRENESKEDLVSYVRAYCGDRIIQRQLDKIDKLPSPDYLTEEDYLVLHGEQPLPHIKWDANIYGMPCAAMKTALNVVYVLKHATSAFDALKISIMMGGDVDSLAAVCTGIAAGKYGLGSLPQELLLQTEGLGRMEDLGGRIYDKFFQNN